MGSGRKTSVLLIVLLIFLISPDVEAQLFKRASVRRTEKKMAGPNRKAKQSREVRKVISEQKKKDVKQKKQYNQAVKENRKHHFSIQSTDVKGRMVQDEKERKVRIREKKRDEKRRSRKMGSKKKYKRM